MIIAVSKQHSKILIVREMMNGVESQDVLADGYKNASPRMRES